ncbi:polymorphic toxin type 43 domain-containing protein [Novosphingobium sp. FSW06-99]|uniref:polymorphic toxin type 43 domain-containing protein n=1 Tax=Novosphingobium sp. FSW06-99 TaxID=1739113 RepID=UPI003517C501
MHIDHHRIGLARFDGFRGQQPALHGVAFAGPGDAARGSGGDQRGVFASQRIVDAQFADRAGGDVLRMGIVLDQRRGAFAPRIERDCAVARANGGGRGPHGVQRAAGRIDRQDGHLVTDQRSGHQPVAAPHDRGERARKIGGDIAWCAARCGNQPQIAADRAEIAHQSADIGDHFAVGRHARKIELILGRGDPRQCATGQINMVKLCHPPVVVAIAFGSSRDKAPAVGGPVVFIDECVGGRDSAQRRGRAIGSDHRDALFVEHFADIAHLRRGSLRCAHLLVRADHCQHRQRLAIGGKARAFRHPRDHRPGHRRAIADLVNRGGPRLAVMGDERQSMPIGRKHRVLIIARGARVEGCQHCAGGG